MATITPVITRPAANITKVFWETLTDADTATAYALVNGAQCSMQLTVGTASGTVVLQGSNDGGTTYATIEDHAGNAITTTAVGTFNFIASTLLVRPSSSGGTSEDWDVHLIVRK